MHSPLRIGLIPAGLVAFLAGFQIPTLAQDTLTLIDSISQVYQTDSLPADSNRGLDGMGEDTTRTGQPCPPCPCGDGGADTNTAPILENDTSGLPVNPPDTILRPDTSFPNPGSPDTFGPQYPNSLPPDTLR